MGLSLEKFTRKKALPKSLILTPVELKYFEGEPTFYKPDKNYHSKPSQWECQRIEMNAMTPREILQYTEQQLETHGVREKVIPGDGELKTQAERIIGERVGDHVQVLLDSLIDMTELERAARSELIEQFASLDFKPGIKEEFLPQFSFFCNSLSAENNFDLFYFVD